MKKILVLLLCFITFGFISSVFAVETQVDGKGYASLTGYDVKGVRKSQDEKTEAKSKKAKSEIIQNAQFNSAIKQAEKRGKQDTKLDSVVRKQVVREAQDNAIKSALNTLLDRVLGAGASKKPEVQDKMEEIFEQIGVYLLDEQYDGEVKDNQYISYAHLTIDETEFRSLISDLGIAINTQNVRAHSILVIVDEFFAKPSNLKEGTLKKESTTFKYDYDEKEKETTKASANVSSEEAVRAGYIDKYGAAGYGGYSKNKASANYGNFYDYSQKESVFFQNIKEYTEAKPVAQNMNFTQPALQDAFVTYDIRSIDNDIFKSKYFKGKNINSDTLSNSSELAKYVEYARKDAKADFFAIGVSYITDNGINKNTGKNVADGNVFVKVYSTADGEVIASGSFTETASGNSADQARTAVARKVGTELGQVLSKKIQDYWKKREMYGQEYIVQIKGSFLPVERATINRTIQNTNGVKNASLRTSDSSLLEFTINYQGNQSTVGDEIFMMLYESNLSSKFKNYDYKINGNQIIFFARGK